MGNRKDPRKRTLLESAFTHTHTLSPPTHPVLHTHTHTLSLPLLTRTTHTHTHTISPYSPILYTHTHTLNVSPPTHTHTKSPPTHPILHFRVHTHTHTLTLSLSHLPTLYSIPSPRHGAGECEETGVVHGGW